MNFNPLRATILVFVGLIVSVFIIAINSDPPAKDPEQERQIVIPESSTKTPQQQGHPLHVAAQKGTPEVIDVLLNTGLDPNARMEDGTTPLHFAAFWNRNPEVITALVEAGANPKTRNESGRTPLHNAAGNNRNPEVVTSLLKAGAEIEPQDVNRRTPLHLATLFNKNPAIIEALLDAGADPNALDNAGQTPWDYANNNDALKGTDAYWQLNELRF